MKRDKCLVEQMLAKHILFRLKKQKKKRNEKIEMGER